MKSATSEGFGLQLPSDAAAGRAAPSAQFGALLTITNTLRPRAAASRTPPSSVVKSYEELPGFVGSGGRCPPATIGQLMGRRTIPAPAATVRSNQTARSAGSVDW